MTLIMTHANIVAISLFGLWMSLCSTALNFTCDTMKEHGAVVQYWNGKSVFVRFLKSGKLVEGLSEHMYFPINRTAGIVSLRSRSPFASSEWALIDLVAGSQKMTISSKHYLNMASSRNAVVSLINAFILAESVDFRKFFTVNLTTGTVDMNNVSYIDDKDWRRFPSVLVVDQIFYAIAGEVYQQPVPMQFYDRFDRVVREEKKIVLGNRYHAGSIVHNGTLYICGGVKQNLTLHTTCLLYNWHTGAKLGEVQHPCGMINEVKMFHTDNEIITIGHCTTDGLHFDLCASRGLSPGTCKTINEGFSAYQVVLPCEESRNESPESQKMVNCWIALVAIVHLHAVNGIQY